MPRPSTLVVFAGLPGAGKSTLAQALARESGATYLRIDSIEQAMRDADVLRGDVGAGGYCVAYAVAEGNLGLGRDVIIDAANTVEIARASWRELADATSAALIEIVIVCSDTDEHRRRVETRPTEVPGLVQPTWQQVLEREWEPWSGDHHVVDTATRSPDEALAEIRRWVGLD